MTSTVRKPKAAFFCEPDAAGGFPDLERVYGRGRLDRVAELTDLYGPVIHRGNLEEHLAALQDVRAVFATWDMPELSEAQVGQLPALEILLYAAGSVQSFARPFLWRGVTVVSAWAANAVPVAEFALAQILLACKGYFRNTRECRSPERRLAGDVHSGPGIYGVKVALIGAGMVAQRLIERLQPFALEILVVDPYLSEGRAQQLGVRLVTLSEAFETAYVVSNHLPNLPATRGLLTAGLFRAMVPGATFINTGRGAQVVEADLVQVLRERSDLTALLDVTDPEPPPAGSPLYTLPNVQLSSHIAGSIRNEVVRMADYVLEECEAWLAGRPLRYAVTLEMLERMA